MIVSLRQPHTFLHSLSTVITHNLHLPFPTHSLSTTVPLHFLFDHHLPLPRFHHSAAAAYSSTLRSHRPIAASVGISGHKRKSQNPSSVSHLILASTPLRAAAKAVQRGDRILNDAIYPATGVAVFYPTRTLSSLPWSLITLCSQQRQTDVADGLCCGGTEELAPGRYDKEDRAARVYDIAALKYRWTPTNPTNFPEVDAAVSCVSSGTCSQDKFFIDMAVRRPSTVVMYLSVGDPESGEKHKKEGK